MKLIYCCPKCEQPVQHEQSLDSDTVICPCCDAHKSIPEGAIEDGRLKQCLICPCSELFVRKAFPQRLGVTIVTIGFILSIISWGYYHIYLTFVILFATALIDLALYFLVGESLTCYRCHSEYHHVEGIENHGAFDLETHERYRQMKARLDQTPKVNQKSTNSSETASSSEINSI